MEGVFNFEWVETPWDALVKFSSWLTDFLLVQTHQQQSNASLRFARPWWGGPCMPAPASVQWTHYPSFCWQMVAGIKEPRGVRQSQPSIWYCQPVHTLGVVAPWSLHTEMQEGHFILYTLNRSNSRFIGQPLFQSTRSWEVKLGLWGHLHAPFNFLLLLAPHRLRCWRSTSCPIWMGSVVEGLMTMMKNWDSQWVGDQGEEQRLGWSSMWTGDKDVAPLCIGWLPGWTEEAWRGRCFLLCLVRARHHCWSGLEAEASLLTQLMVRFTSRLIW